MSAPRRGRPPKERKETRHRTEKPLKLDAKHLLELPRFQNKKLKWCDYDDLSTQLANGWEVVTGLSSDQQHGWTPDGRKVTEESQKDEGGAYTQRVGVDKFGKPRLNWLLEKDLDRYNAEDAVWNKEEADRPMDVIQESATMGARAGLGGDVEAYQPRDGVKISKQRDAY